LAAVGRQASAAGTHILPSPCTLAGGPLPPAPIYYPLLAHSAGLCRRHPYVTIPLHTRRQASPCTLGASAADTHILPHCHPLAHSAPLPPTPICCDSPAYFALRPSSTPWNPGPLRPSRLNIFTCAIRRTCRICTSPIPSLWLNEESINYRHYGPGWFLFG
jgi:hypothetical protein